MNKHYINYTNQLTEKVREPIDTFIDKKFTPEISLFDFNSHRTGLLFGYVQSGKTGHMLATIAKAADMGIEFFVVLTTDNKELQQQTLKRCLTVLDSTFSVIDEWDEMRFSANDMRKPVVLVLKKNVSILERWLKHIKSSKFLQGRPLFIIDDEADAASLNTKINKPDDDVSKINACLTSLRNLANSSLYLQVTATPQSVLLQGKSSTYKPDFSLWFEPGTGYIGGNFLYNVNNLTDEDELPYCISLTAEDEADKIKNDDDHIPAGMESALLHFFIASADLMQRYKRPSCNFIIHPSVSTSDHDLFAKTIGKMLNTVLMAISEQELTKAGLREAWLNLKKSEPDILDYQKCYDFIEKMFEEDDINVHQMNSKTNRDELNLNCGMNIIIGGNTLGRGVTFPNLQTVYYCRKSKTPQADTFCQHSRVFGYDRVKGLMRVFMPPSLFKLYVKLNESNNVLFDFIKKNGIEDIKLVYPKGVRPTRQNVIDKKELQLITGGANAFPNFPSQTNTSQIDKLLIPYSAEDKQFYRVNVDLILSLLTLCESENNWAESYINCINMLDPNTKCILMVRKDRDIGKDTGTLLSPDDRKLGDNFKKEVVLTLYRVLGTVKKGWSGQAFWIPNIKLPAEYIFHGMYIE